MLNPEIFETLIIGFSIYSLLFNLLGLNKKFLSFTNVKNMDKTACIIFALAGLGWLACWVFNTLTEYHEATEEYAKYALINRWTGPYFWAFWLTPLLYLQTQLFWVPKIRNLRWLRVAYSAVFLVPWHHLLIHIVSANRDYLPSSWLPYSFWQLLLGYLFCAGIFIISLVTVHYLFTSYQTYVYKRTKNI